MDAIITWNKRVCAPPQLASPPHSSFDTSYMRPSRRLICRAAVVELKLRESASRWMNLASVYMAGVLVLRCMYRHE